MPESLGPQPEDLLILSIQIHVVCKINEKTTLSSHKKQISSKYSTVQYSTVQYSTVQYSTVQYSTLQDRVMLCRSELFE